MVNRTRPVSDAVRKKVEDAIAQLHYVPSAVARSLKVRTTSIIGLLVPNSTNPYFAELSRGIEDCCERNGYCVILCNSDDNPQKQANYLRVLRRNVSTAWSWRPPAATARWPRDWRTCARRP